MTILLLFLALSQQSDVYHPGTNGVTAPTIASKVDPEYTEAARKEKIQGTVVLEVVINEEGVPKVTRVVRTLGYGLDENAVKALEQWRFRPGTKDGQPVKVGLNVEVNFNLQVDRKP